jgi:GNAT superfamily N-acetyltransferase
MSENNTLSSNLTFIEVTPQTWGDFEALFECRGGPKSCWCMVWRATPSEAKTPDGKSRKLAMEKRIAAHTRVGILGYLDGLPIAWCSIAPRPTYRPLGGVGDLDDTSVWSLTCLFLKREYRGLDFSAALIKAAINFAKQNGATVVEAYPVNPNSPSFRFMGFVPAFEKLGFEHVSMAGTRRHVMQIKLSKPEI